MSERRRFVVAEAEAGSRVDRFLADQLPEPTSGVGAPAVESCPLNDDADETRCDR